MGVIVHNNGDRLHDIRDLSSRSVCILTLALDLVGEVAYLVLGVEEESGRARLQDGVSVYARVEAGAVVLVGEHPVVLGAVVGTAVVVIVVVAVIVVVVVIVIVVLP